jgi:WD40 repeat protein
MSFPSGKLIHRIHAHDDIDGVNTRINGLIFGPDESSLLSSSGDNTLKEWCIDSGEFIRRFDGQGESIEGIALSPDRTLLGICESHAILVFDSRTWEILLSIPYSRHIHWPTLAFSPNNRMLAFVTTHENDVKLYSTRSGELLDSLFGHTSGITRICFSPNGEYLATASDDDTLKLWKVPV